MRPCGVVRPDVLPSWLEPRAADSWPLSPLRPASIWILFSIGISTSTVSALVVASWGTSPKRTSYGESGFNDLGSRFRVGRKLELSFSDFEDDRLAPVRVSVEVGWLS